MGSKSETDGEEDKDDVVASKMAGGDAASVPYRASGDPVVVLLCGLQGAGKTTAAGKLARYFKEVETIAGEGGGSVEDGTLLEEVGNRVKTNRSVSCASATLLKCQVALFGNFHTLALTKTTPTPHKKLLL